MRRKRVFLYLKSDQKNIPSKEKDIWIHQLSHSIIERPNGGIADGYLKFWMALEFNRNAGHKIFGPGKAQKEILKELDDVKFREIRAKSPLHEELLYRECKHLVKFYMTLCAQDKNYNSILCGLITIKKESSEAKMKRDIYETAIRLPKDLNLEEELALVTKAAHEVYGQEYPEESGFPE